MRRRVVALHQKYREKKWPAALISAIGQEFASSTFTPENHDIFIIATQQHAIHIALLYLSIALLL